jgi:lipopolysaccharide biosynthesis glycosyltransferase
MPRSVLPGMESTNRFAIVACATPAWLGPAAVTLWSCATQGAAVQTDLLLVCHNPSRSDAADLERFNALRGTRIRLIAVDATELASRGGGRWGLGTLIRLKLDQYLPQSYERVLYVDADVLALRDISDIFSIDMGGHALAAVPDVGARMSRKTIQHVRRLGLDTHPGYFNAGILLFDWRSTCASGYLACAMDLLLSGKRWPLLDQDVLNVASEGRWKPLALQWNVQQWLAEYLGDAADSEARFRHFVGRHKPWNSPDHPACRGARKIYAECLAQTSWEPLLDVDQASWSFASRLHWLRQRCRVFRKARMHALLNS